MLVRVHMLMLLVLKAKSSQPKPNHKNTSDWLILYLSDAIKGLSSALKQISLYSSYTGLRNPSHLSLASFYPSAALLDFGTWIKAIPPRHPRPFRRR